MATFVLVHGSFCGGWVWRPVVPLLRGAGHEVWAPTLTGLGERADLLSPAVGLATHVDDIARVLFYEDLRDVVLVGPSDAGMVITGVAEAAANRLARLVYLDAFVPEDGRCAFDLIPGLRERWYAAFAVRDGVAVPADAAPTEVADPATHAWVRARMTPMPLRTHEDPLTLPRCRAADLPRSYIRCTGWPTFAETAAQAEAAGWDIHELPATHLAMVTAPATLARVLLAIAAG